MKFRWAILIIASLVASVLITHFATVSLLHNEVTTSSGVPEGYLYLKTETFHAFEIWQDNVITSAQTFLPEYNMTLPEKYNVTLSETKVNDTTTVLDVWYSVYYNNTDGTIGMDVFKSYVENVTTDMVYCSFNTSQAIQWAIENTQEIVEFHNGVYNITCPIFLDRSNITLLGLGSTLRSNKSPIFDLSTKPVQNIQISGFWLMRGNETAIIG